ncbi:TspO/MBR family protein [Microcella humidisoli]|uniref:Tryptophan-rich sensory protein n=1 Tax=Microcella humidisoli TaxID=2963406 RepID=A0ABY5FWY4_9MICO|nr:TspO/MBR family protein [Microcella humidisoli]UTT62644.1 tryptophan-rich sensory protein [Microcella humidisoli]
MARRTATSTALSLLVLGAIIAINVLSATLGSAVSQPFIQGWYAEAVKPGWTPPNWVFSAVWTVLYLSTSVAAWLVWRQRRRRRVDRALTLYAVQLVLNAIWSPLFFALYPVIGETATWLSLTVHVLLLVAIIVTIAEFRPIDRAAAVLMMPYLVWVTYAATLTIGIALLN